MDNTQKPSSPPTFDPMSPPTYPPSPTFPQEPPPITPPPPPPPPPFPTTPSWPPAPEPAPVSSQSPPAPNLSSNWPPVTPPPPPPPNTSTSPLDNPWGAPFQPPPWTPPAPPPVQTSDSPPTDLSHLVGNNSQPEPAPTNLNQAETLIVPSTVTPETSPEPPEHKKGLPKWLIGVGAGLLLAVLGVSAYFIIGIGRTSKTTSLPAIDTSQTTQIKPPAPIATPVSQQSAPATDSASFGDLQGGGQQATRAGDLLRQGR